MNHSTGPTRNGGHWPANGRRNESADGPPTALLTASFYLAGLGTVLLGPVLPQLLHEWALTDERGGLLLLAKFTGSFFGGVAVPRQLRLGILAGHCLAAAGLGAFALSHNLAQALPALVLGGFGLGEIIASTNILAGRRWPAHTGSALASINFFWSFGAVSTGLLAAALLPRFGWRTPTLCLAALLLLVGLAGPLSRHQTGTSSTDTEALSPNPPPAKPRPAEPQAASPDRTLSAPTVARFSALLLLYGGLETCLTAWLTTFALRITNGGALLGGQSGFVVLWIALTAGRVLASLAMRRWNETVVQRFSLFLCLVLTFLLSQAHSTAALSSTCILLGLALAPVFPSTFALLLQQQPTARVAGSVLAVSGLGAALFPWLMGTVSTHTGSLRLAMLVPACLIPAMLACTGKSPNHSVPAP